MEFPDLGEQCSHSQCKQLDFLPLKCDLCSKTFCWNHFRYESHSCVNSYMSDQKVPICPLCSQPISVRRGELPDIRVGQHIDRDCESDPAMKKRNAIYKNKCSVKGCKQKELMQLLCNDCGRNHCLKHRHSADHNCKPLENNKTSKSGSAALQRLTQNRKNSQQMQSTNHSKHNSQRIESQTNNLFEVQGNYSEDEALARALHQSMIENKNKNTNQTLAQKTTSREEEDRNLAEAIAESQTNVHKNKDKCYIS